MQCYRSTCSRDHHYELPCESQQDDLSWDGSLDFGEQLGASYKAASEAVDTSPGLLSSWDDAGSGNDAAATMGSHIVRLPGLPSGRRVSLLAGCVAGLRSPYHAMHVFLVCSTA